MRSLRRRWFSTSVSNWRGRAERDGGGDRMNGLRSMVVYTGTYAYRALAQARFDQFTKFLVWAIETYHTLRREGVLPAISSSAVFILVERSPMPHVDSDQRMFPKLQASSVIP
jgi:hypothetical protein